MAISTRSAGDPAIADAPTRDIKLSKPLGSFMASVSIGKMRLDAEEITVDRDALSVLMDFSRVISSPPVIVSADVESALTPPGDDG
jgi:hypothetical protein